MTFIYRVSMESTAKNASGTLILLLAESSKVRSNHWVAAVIAGFITSHITYLAMDAILSLLMGLRL